MVHYALGDVAVKISFKYIYAKQHRCTIEAQVFDLAGRPDLRVGTGSCSRIPVLYDRRKTTYSHIGPSLQVGTRSCARVLILSLSFDLIRPSSDLLDGNFTMVYNNKLEYQYTLDLLRWIA